MAETRVTQVLDAVVAQLRATSGYRAPTDATGPLAATLVTVYDGAEIRSTDDASGQSHVVIGWPGESDAELSQVANIVLSTGPIAGANHPRDDTGAIACKVTSDSGWSTQKAARDAALQVIADVAHLCRLDPSLGIDTSDTIGGVRTLTWVTAGAFWQYLGSAGYVCEWDFTVSYDSRV